MPPDTLLSSEERHTSTFWIDISDRMKGSADRNGHKIRDYKQHLEGGVPGQVQIAAGIAGVAHHIPKHPRQARLLQIGVTAACGACRAIRHCFRIPPSHNR